MTGMELIDVTSDVPTVFQDQEREKRVECWSFEKACLVNYAIFNQKVLYYLFIYFIFN